MTETTVVHDALILGAGLAGLTAAHRLRQSGCDVVVVEASARVGGRLLRQQAAGAVVDGGGAWVGPTQHAVLGLLGELGLHTTPTYNDGRHLFRLRGATRARAGDLPPLPPLALADAALALARLDRLARRLPRKADALDRTTVGAWLDQHVRTHGARTLLEIAVGTTTGAAAHELSLLAFTTHVRSAGGMQQLVGVRGAAQDSRVVGGAVSMCERLVERIGRHRVHLSSPAVAVEQREDAAVVRIAGGQADYAARKIIVAMDPACCAGIDFGPALTEAPRWLHRTWTMGSGIKFHVAYPTPFWRRFGLSGQAFADDGLVRIVFDATPGEHDGPGVLAGFLGAPLADEFEQLAPGARADRAARVISDLTRLFGPAAASYLDYVEHDWRAEPYLAGCVPALRPGVISASGADPLRPFGRVHWAGAETAHVWEGHMDGAVRSGEHAATQIAGSAVEGV